MLAGSNLLLNHVRFYAQQHMRYEAHQSGSGSLAIDEDKEDKEDHLAAIKEALCTEPKMTMDDLAKNNIGQLYSLILHQQSDIFPKHVLSDCIEQFMSTRKRHCDCMRTNKCTHFSTCESDRNLCCCNNSRRISSQKRQSDSVSAPVTPVTPDSVRYILQLCLGQEFQCIYRGEEWSPCFCDSSDACTCKERDGAAELFMWSIIFFIQYETMELASVFLDHTKNQLGALLTAYTIMEAVHDGKITGQLVLGHRRRIKIKRQADNLQRCIIRLLDALVNEEFYIEDTTEQPSHLFNIISSSSGNAGTSYKWSAAVLYLLTICREYGNMSPMTLAMRSDSQGILTHDLCCEVTRIIWEHGGRVREGKNIKSSNMLTTLGNYIELYRSPRLSYWLNLIVFLVFLCMYAYAILAGLYSYPFDVTGSRPDHTTAATVCEISILLYIIGIISEESVQIRYNRRSYLSDQWNWLTMFSLLAYFLGIGLQHGSTVECYEAARIIRSLDFMAFMYLLLQYLSLSNRWGPMLPMLFRMIQGLLEFLAVLSLFIVTFAVGTHAIFCPQDYGNNTDSGLFTRLFTRPWLFLYGVINLQGFSGELNDNFHYCESRVFYDESSHVISVYHDQNGNFEGIEVPLPETRSAFAPAILASQVLLTNIMMLSVLIAIFNDTYRKVQDKKQMHHKHQFLQLTLEYYRRHVLPPPFGIAAQLFFLFRHETMDNPFGQENARPHVIKFFGLNLSALLLGGSASDTYRSMQKVEESDADNIVKHKNQVSMLMPDDRLDKLMAACERIQQSVHKTNKRTKSIRSELANLEATMKQQLATFEQERSK